jgi:hypothetical protein
LRLLNASVDGLGDVVTLYFDRALDMDNLPSASQFTVTNGSAATISRSMSAPCARASWIW